MGPCEIRSAQRLSLDQFEHKRLNEAAV